MADVEPAPRYEENRAKLALKEPFNTVPLGVAVIAAIGLAMTLPAAAVGVLGAGVIFEGVYLLTIPKSKWYASRLSKRFDAAASERREALRKEIGPKLRPTVLARFDRLVAARKQMDGASEKGTTKYDEVLHKVDYLLDKYLEFGAKEQEFRLYLRSVYEECLRELGTLPTGGHVTSRSATEATLPGEPALDPAEPWIHAIVERVLNCFQQDLKNLDEQDLRDPDDLPTNALLEKRKDVLHRRCDYVSQIGKILSNLNHQLELMEDTLGLINDELRARSPEQVLADIDDVVYKADALMDMLSEVAPANPMPAKYAASQEVKA
jgi:hypothetical protein